MSNASKKGEDSPLLRAYLAIRDLEAKVEALERARREPVAVVGLGCRFPGAATPEQFWELLRTGQDATREVPSGRWNVAEFFDSAPQTPGKSYTRRGGYLEEVSGFDPEFFGLSPGEAAAMDPQQRLLLEVSWEALERAGISPGKLSGSRAGVFVGLMNLDYPQQMLVALDPNRIDAFVGTGSEPSFLAGRLCYLLGLQGPSLVVATACSSSLVAVHLACQSLRANECRLALAGGVNLILNPHANIVLSKMNALSPDGRCKCFDAAADGYGRGEGCGVVVLKRLSDALAEGDPILAVIRGSAVNHGGPSGGLTIPSGPAQAAVIRDALHNAGVEPSQVSYVEAHGTGTSLGDPIELRALASVLGQGRAEGQRFHIGSVKANIGHLEAAAGIAGLIKVVLALNAESIPPQPLLLTPNPHIPWSELPLRVSPTSVPWPRGEQARLAGLSSFGLSGINAHVVLEDSPRSEFVKGERERPWHLLTLSARTDSALRELARLWGGHLGNNSHESFPDVAYSGNTVRSGFDHRLAVIADTGRSAGESLTAFARGVQVEGVRGGVKKPGLPARVAFVFPGDRAEYIGMARRLHETQATFQEAIDRCARVLDGQLKQSLVSTLYPSPGSASHLTEPLNAHAALFAVEYALAALWRSWGVEPSAVLGHGAGEYVAACVAGVLSLEDASHLLMTRARVIQYRPHDGAMATVHADERRVREALAPLSGSVLLAAVEGPRRVVLSGNRDSVLAVLTRLEREGVQTEMWRTTQAFLVPETPESLDEIERSASEVHHQPSRIPFVSGLTGEVLSDKDFVAGYWRRHAGGPVQFHDAARRLVSQGCDIVLEVSPSPVLIEAGLSCAGEATWLGSLRPERDDWLHLLETLQTLYLKGIAVNWSDFDRPYSRRRIALPTYPFERRRCWIDGLGTGMKKTRSSDMPVSPLSGRPVRTPLPEEIVETSWSLTALPLLADHTVYGQPVAPAACSLVLALTRCGSLTTLADVTFREPLFVNGDGVTLQLVVSPPVEAHRAFRICSSTDRPEDEWHTAVTGEYQWGDEAEKHSLGDIRSRCTEERSPDDFYQALSRSGPRPGTCFSLDNPHPARSGRGAGAGSRIES